MCRRLKATEVTRDNSNACSEDDAETSLAHFPIFVVAACSDSASTRHAHGSPMTVAVVRHASSFVTQTTTRNAATDCPRRRH